MDTIESLQRQIEAQVEEMNREILAEIKRLYAFWDKPEFNRRKVNRQSEEA